jgi:hypothetical protein
MRGTRAVAISVLLAMTPLPPSRPASSRPHPGASSRPHPGAPACRIFPDDHVWHADVRSLPVHGRSAEWIRAMGGRSQRLHPDFGPSGDPLPYGIPYDVEGDAQAKVSIDFDYADESDPGPYPVDGDSTVEGGSDRHVLVLHRDECRLYEVFDFQWNGGDPRAGSGAIWDLGRYRLRPRGWTSADAAGLPIFAGLIRRDEVVAGRIDHPIRMTARQTDRRFLWPARHQAGARRDPSLPPMGAWFRLKRSFDISGFRRETKVILRAMRRHGLIVADNGSNWYFGGAAEHGWTQAVLDELKSLRAGAFQAVDTRPMKIRDSSGRVRPRYVGV